MCVWVGGGSQNHECLPAEMSSAEPMNLIHTMHIHIHIIHTCTDLYHVRISCNISSCNVRISFITGLNQL